MRTFKFDINEEAYKQLIQDIKDEHPHFVKKMMDRIEKKKKIKI